MDSATAATGKRRKNEFIIHHSSFVICARVHAHRIDFSVGVVGDYHRRDVAADVGIHPGTRAGFRGAAVGGIDACGAKPSGF